MSVRGDVIEGDGQEWDRFVLRRQLPVMSPLTWPALWSGVRAATSRARARDARLAVTVLLRARFASPQVLLTDSGTSALALAIRAGAGANRPVAIPAYGCFDLATAVDASGSSFVLYDVDPATLAPNPSSVRRAIAHGADRIVVAHLYGLPVDIASLRALARDEPLSVIDDAAQGVGASIGGVPVGALGDIGVLSFGRGKGMTGGGGGALLFGEALDETLSAPPRVRDGLRWVREVFGAGAQWALGRPSLYAIPTSLPFLGLGETRYGPPHQVTDISPFCLGVLQETLALADGESATRRGHAARLQGAIEGFGIALPAVAQAAIPGYLRLPVVASVAMAEAARGTDARRLGIMPGYPIPLSELPGFGERRLNREERCEGARMLADRLITLPVHGAMTDADLGAVEQWCFRAH